MSRAWFAARNCDSLEIINYKKASDRAPSGRLKTDDVEAVGKLMARIEKIPASGDLMKKIGPEIPVTEMVFSCGSESATIKIYGDSVQTPSTGFNAKIEEAESRLIEDIRALSQPELGKSLLKLKGAELSLKDFSVTYLGEFRREVPGASLSSTVESFLIRDKKGQEQTIEVSYGQVPPVPKSFRVGLFSDLSLRLLRGEHEERLFPDYFQIVK